MAHITLKDRQTLGKAEACIPVWLDAFREGRHYATKAPDRYPYNGRLSYVFDGPFLRIPTGYDEGWGVVAQLRQMRGEDILFFDRNAAYGWGRWAGRELIENVRATARGREFTTVFCFLSGDGVSRLNAEATYQHARDHAVYALAQCRRCRSSHNKDIEARIALEEVLVTDEIRRLFHLDEVEFPAVSITALAPDEETARLALKVAGDADPKLYANLGWMRTDPLDEEALASL